MGVQIDKTGRDEKPCRLDHPFVTDRQRLADLDDVPIADTNVTTSGTRLINERSPCDDDVLYHGCASRIAHDSSSISPVPNRSKSTAIRTATP